MIEAKSYMFSKALVKTLFLRTMTLILMSMKLLEIRKVFSRQESFSSRRVFMPVVQQEQQFLGH